MIGGKNARITGSPKLCQNSGTGVMQDKTSFSKTVNPKMLHQFEVIVSGRHRAIPLHQSSLVPGTAAILSRLPIGRGFLFHSTCEPASQMEL
jgi:hypothetical protein